MKRAASILLVAVLLVAAGCATHPSRRWAQARELLTDTQDAMVQQHQMGTLSDYQLVTADTYVRAARRALEVAEQQLPDGGDQMEDHLAVAAAALQALADLRREADP